MPFQSTLPELPQSISSTEAQALARYVHDLELRMRRVAELLEDRGKDEVAGLAGSIVHDLRLLEVELAASQAAHAAEPERALAT